MALVTPETNTAIVLVNKPTCVGTAVTVICAGKPELSGMLLNEKPFALVNVLPPPKVIEAPKSRALAGNVFVTKTMIDPAVRLVTLMV